MGVPTDSFEVLARFAVIGVVFAYIMLLILFLLPVAAVLNLLFQWIEVSATLYVVMGLFYSFCIGVYVSKGRD